MTLFINNKHNMTKYLGRLVGMYKEEELLIHINAFRYTVHSEIALTNVFLEFNRGSYTDVSHKLSLVPGSNELTFDALFDKHSMFFREKVSPFPSYQEKMITFRAMGLTEEGEPKILGKGSFNISNYANSTFRTVELELKGPAGKSILHLSVSVINADQQSMIGVLYDQVADQDYKAHQRELKQASASKNDVKRQDSKDFVKRQDSKDYVQQRQNSMDNDQNELTNNIRIFPSSCM